MPQEIYNEGRVVGYSAWELFKSHEISSGVPEGDIPNENEWITSMIGSGASMILKIPSGTIAGVHDFPLPENSKLTAAGVIVASPFMGMCNWTNTTPYWATRVMSYGDHLIINHTSLSPSDDGTVVPYDNVNHPTDYNDMVRNYLKISDGIVFTLNANWEITGRVAPYKDIDPKFNNSTAVVRLYISADISSDVSLLLTGFANKRILQGFSQWASDEGGYAKHGSADIDSNDWVNGGMLGPEVIPWASKIIFSVPNLTSSNTSLTRTIPSDESYTETGDNPIADAYNFKDITATVTDNPVIDFNSIVLSDYYDAHSFNGTPTLEIETANISNNSNYVVAWYPGMSASAINYTKTHGNTDYKKSRFFPPALYGQHITSNGTKELVPLDVAAPGTIKCFEDSAAALSYKTLLPDNYSLQHLQSSGNYVFVNPTMPDSSWPSTVKATVGASVPISTMIVGDKSIETITFLRDGNPNSRFDTSGSDGTITIGPSKIDNNPDSGRNLTWDVLISSLVLERGVDALGPWLRSIGTELSDNSAATDPYLQNKHTIGLMDTVTTGPNSSVSGNIDYIASKWFLLNPGTKAQNWIKSDSVWIGSKVDSTDNNRYITFNSGETPASLNLGTDFIKFNNGLKLFVSTSAPDPAVVGAIPNNSIGLGW